MTKSHLATGFRQQAEDQLAKLEAALREAEESIRHLDAERAQINAEVLALRSLLAIDDGEPLQDRVRSHPYAVGAKDVAIEILRESDGREMHYRLLADEVVQRGGNLPAKSPAAALNAIMNRDERFVRPSKRGFYALREHHPSIRENVGTRHSRSN